MKAAVITGHGGMEVVQVVDNLPVPEPGMGEVRIQVKAAEDTMTVKNIGRPPY